jgi:hypothetical protein
VFGFDIFAIVNALVLLAFTSEMVVKVVRTARLPTCQVDVFRSALH